MKQAIRIGATIIICVSIVLGYYYYLSHRYDTGSSEDSAQYTEVERILIQDFENSYPSTPRSVVKWYNRIITALYSEDYTDAELEAMADQLRMLLDDELLSYNDRDAYITSLRSNVADYRNRDKEIVSSSLSSSNDITYATVNGYYCAYVEVYYFCREGSSYSRTYEDFVLRQDADGKWKILTFSLSQESSND